MYQAFAAQLMSRVHLTVIVPVVRKLVHLVLVLYVFLAPENILAT